MAENKSLFGRLVDKVTNASEVKTLKQQLDQLIDKTESFEASELKFYEGETSSTYSGISEFEFGGIDQNINDTMLQRIYCTETWVYTAVTAIAKSISSLPIKLEKRVLIKEQIENDITGQMETVDQEKWVDASGEKLFNRFQYPNKFSSQSEFMMQIVIDFLTTGHYYIYLDSDEDLSLIAEAEFDDDSNSPFGRLRNLLAANTVIKGMYRIPPGLMKPVMDQDSYGPKGYVMTSDRGQFAFNCAEIIHVKLPNPLNPLVGLAPLMPALKPILLDRYSTEHMIRFYKTGARLGGIVESEKAMTKEQLARFQRSFENNYTGRHNFHRTLVLGPGMSYKQIEQNPAETALLDFCKYNREAILAVFNVPPIKVGILDHANYANALAQLRIYFTDTVLPYLSFIEDGFNLKNTLMPDTRSYRIKFDLTEVEALKENNKDMAETAKFMMDGGLSVNEVRKRIWNAAPVKDGEKVKAIEDMSKPTPQPFIPYANRGADEGIVESKDAAAVTPEINNASTSTPTPQSQALASDIVDTKLSYSQRVAQLTQIFIERDKLPLAEAIRRAVEQAIQEGYDPNDPDGGPKPTNAPAPNSEGPAPEKELPAELESTQIAPIENAQVAELIAPKIYAFGYSKDTIVEEWKGFISKMDPLIEKREGEVRKFFKEFRSIVMNQLGANVKAFGLHKARDNSDADEILDPAHFEKLIKEYIAQIDAILMDAYEKGYVETLVNFKFDVRNEQALEQLRKYAGDRIQGIVDTTREQIKSVLTDAFDAGVAVNEISQRLNEKFAEISTGRASTIARTETLTAVSMGRQEKREDFQKQFPDKKLKKMWVSAQDDKVRDSHQELDGEVRDSDEEFKANLMFPRDPSCDDPAEVINCRCTDMTFAEEDQAQVDASLNDQSSNESDNEEKSLDKKEQVKVTRHRDETFDHCIQRAIPLLINEGRPKDQAVAMAYSMCELPKKKEN